MKKKRLYNQGKHLCRGTSKVQKLVQQNTHLPYLSYKSPLVFSDFILELNLFFHGKVVFANYFEYCNLLYEGNIVTPPIGVDAGLGSIFNLYDI